MRVEMIRAILKHPYQRQPYGVQRCNMYAASDMAIVDHYPFKYVHLMPPSMYNLVHNMHYEWYLQNIPPRKDGKNRDQREDENGSREDKNRTRDDECINKGKDRLS